MGAKAREPAVSDHRERVGVLVAVLLRQLRPVFAFFPGLVGVMGLLDKDVPDKELQRAVSFTDYIPYSLANVSPTEQDQQESMQMADIAAEELASNPDCMFWLPSLNHIVRIDGVWKVLWFAGRHVCPQEYDVRRYFQNLCQQAIEQHNR